MKPEARSASSARAPETRWVTGGDAAVSAGQPGREGGQQAERGDRRAVRNLAWGKLSIDSLSSKVLTGPDRERRLWDQSSRFKSWLYLVPAMWHQENSLPALM